MRLTINAIFYINLTDRFGDRQTPGRHERLSYVSPTPGGGADIRLAQYTVVAPDGALRFQEALNNYVRPGCEPTESELA